MIRVSLRHSSAGRMHTPHTQHAPGTQLPLQKAALHFHASYVDTLPMQKQVHISKGKTIYLAYWPLKAAGSSSCSLPQTTAAGAVWYLGSQRMASFPLPPATQDSRVCL